jgi:hypothetical protein
MSPKAIWRPTGSQIQAPATRHPLQAKLNFLQCLVLMAGLWDAHILLCFVAARCCLAADTSEVSVFERTNHLHR